MKKRSLTQIKEFVRRTQIDGEPEGKAAKEIFHVSEPYQLIRSLKETDDYNMMLEAVVKSMSLMAQKEFESLQLKKIRAQSDLIDRGNELMNEAETLKDKIRAQQNQRENISIQQDIYSSTRNQQDFGDVLEGVIIS